MSQLAICLVFDPTYQKILVKKVLGKTDYLYDLPVFQVYHHENIPAELKRELNEDFQIQVKFLKILPETWSRLVFTKAAKEKFKIFYIFETEQFPKNIEWLSLAELKNGVVAENNLPALKLLADTYGIITN